MSCNNRKLNKTSKRTKISKRSMSKKSQRGGVLENACILDHIDDKMSYGSQLCWFCQ